MTDNTLEAQRAAVTRAIEAYNVGKTALFAHDGRTPIAAPTVHEEKLTRLLTPVEAAVQRAVEAADTVIADVEARRLAPFADPTAALSPAELDDANRRAAFVKEDCVSSLPLPELVERLRAVEAGGVKSSIWLHHRYARQRWELESSKTPQPPDLAQFGEALRQLGVIGPRAGLDPALAKRADDARGLKRWATSQLDVVRTGKRGTGAPMGL